MFCLRPYMMDRDTKSLGDLDALPMVRFFKIPVDFAVKPFGLVASMDSAVVGKP